MPVPAFNIINGGSHAGNKLAMQVVGLPSPGNTKGKKYHCTVELLFVWNQLYDNRHFFVFICKTE
jgi:enolase